MGSKLVNTQFLESVPEAGEQKSLILRLLTMSRGYTASSPLRVGFVYDADIEESCWIDSYEAGRLYVDEMTADNVVTAAYRGNKDNVRETIDKAAKDGCGIIFTVSPAMMSDAVKAAVQYPNVKILNCSFGNPAATVRCYYGKLYEAAFLMGVLAADKLLTEYGGERRIGYLVRNGDASCIRDLNAFAIGVSMIDPGGRISLKNLTSGAPRALWTYSRPSCRIRRASCFRSLKTP